jgi:hypothetical protein
MAGVGLAVVVVESVTESVAGFGDSLEHDARVTPRIMVIIKAFMWLSSQIFMEHVADASGEIRAGVFRLLIL